jgi:hypothetical protein
MVSRRNSGSDVSVLVAGAADPFLGGPSPGFRLNLRGTCKIVHSRESTSPACVRSDVYALARMFVTVAPAGMGRPQKAAHASISLRRFSRASPRR